MKRLALAPALRRRLLPLVLAVGVIVAASAPVAFYAEKRGELVAGARADAARVARVLTEAARRRPRLWRYDAAKLAERLAAEGLGRLDALVVRDARGVDVPLPSAGVRDLFYGHAALAVDGARVGDVWVGVGAAPLTLATAKLAALFCLLGGVLALVLLRVPLAAMGAAQKRIEGLMAQLAITLQEDDRRRIARDLHDGAGQALTAARLRLLALQKSSPDAAALALVGEHLDEALDEVRRSTTALLPPALAEHGLVGALERHCRSFGAAVGLEVRCQLGALPALPAPVEVACYRIVQEALSNTARHSGARAAWVQLRHAGGELCLEVGDDGAGLSAPEARLESIRDRARLIGASVVCRAAGARIEVRVPLEVGA